MYLAGIVGHRGYSGAELIRILDRHPQVSPVLLEHREDAGSHSHVRGAPARHTAPSTADAVRAEGIAVVFLATPGVSGAGRKPTLKTSFCEITENFSAYSVLHHRHVPEVLLTSGLEESEFSFTAQLLPLDRGILETIYFRAKDVAATEDLLAI